MVKILPSNQDAGKFGDIVGSGLQQGLKKGFDVQFQRGQLQDALAKARSSMKPGASPTEVALSLMEAGAGIPGFERYAGQLLPLLMTQARGQSTNENVPELGGAQTGQPGLDQSTIQPGMQTNKRSVAPTKETAESILADAQKSGMDLPRPEIDPEIFGGDLEPTRLNMGPIPPTYSEGQILKAQQQDAARGLDPSPAAAVMQNYNENARARQRDYVTAAQAHASIAESREASQGRFTQALKDALGGEKTPADTLALAERIAQRPEYRNQSNNALRAKAVADAVKQYEGSRETFRKASNRPNPLVNQSGYENDLKNLGEKAQFYLKNGQREQLYSDLASNGWSESEIAQITNPLDPSILQAVKDFPKYKQEITSSGTSGINVRQKDVQENIKSRQRMGDFLEKHIKPGKVDPKNADSITPGTSLILLRNQFVNKGWGGRIFDQVLSGVVGKMREEGKDLDSRQTAEFNMMSEHPAKTYSLWEMITGPK